MNYNSFSFNNEQMNGIVENTYNNILKECENLKKITNCHNEQIVALLSIIATSYAPITNGKTN